MWVWGREISRPVAPPASSRNRAAPARDRQALGCTFLLWGRFAYDPTLRRCAPSRAAGGAAFSRRRCGRNSSPPWQDALDDLSTGDRLFTGRTTTSSGTSKPAAAGRAPAKTASGFHKRGDLYQTSPVHPGDGQHSHSPLCRGRWARRRPAAHGHNRPTQVRCEHRRGRPPERGPGRFSPHSKRLALARQRIRNSPARSGPGPIRADWHYWASTTLRKFAGATDSRAVPRDTRVAAPGLQPLTELTPGRPDFWNDYTTRAAAPLPQSALGPIASASSIGRNSTPKVANDISIAAARRRYTESCSEKAEQPETNLNEERSGSAQVQPGYWASRRIEIDPLRRPRMKTPNGLS